MDLVSIATTLLEFALLGFLVYLIITYVPMPEPYRQVIVVASVVLIILYLLYLLGGHAVSLKSRG